MFHLGAQLNLTIINVRDVILEGYMPLPHLVSIPMGKNRAPGKKCCKWTTVGILHVLNTYMDTR